MPASMIWIHRLPSSSNCNSLEKTARPRSPHREMAPWSPHGDPDHRGLGRFEFTPHSALQLRGLRSARKAGEGWRWAHRLERDKKNGTQTEPTFTPTKGVIRCESDQIRRSHVAVGLQAKAGSPGLVPQTCLLPPGECPPLRFGGLLHLSHGVMRDSWEGQKVWFTKTGFCRKYNMSKTLGLQPHPQKVDGVDARGV